MVPPNQAFQANYTKRALAFAVTFAPCDGELQTLEGKVQFAAGDALMTGVLGEHWPIRRQTFESTYEPCDLQSMGLNGNYRKRAIPVFAQQLTQAHIMKLNVALPTQRRAARMSSNGLRGSSGRYLSVRNSDSENGLSLLTEGRLREAATPKRCMVANMVSPFMGEPLSECTVS